MWPQIEFLNSLVVVLLYGCFVSGKLLSRATKDLEPWPPHPIERADWHQITVRGSGGRWIGALEGILFVGAFYYGADGVTLIGWWLAFKVGSKWAAWQHIVQFPCKLEERPNGCEIDITELDLLRARTSLSSWLLTRLLIGTLLNILGAAAAWYLGSHFYEIVQFLAHLGRP